jgi:hypothetical protein
MLGLGSCQMLGITKMDRLSKFGADLNAGKSHMNENFAKGQTADYTAVNTQAFWDTIGVTLPGSTYQGYSLSVHDYVDPSNVTVDIYGPPTFYNFNIAWPVGGPVPAKFVLVQIGEDWFIKAIYLDGVLAVK